MNVNLYVIKDYENETTLRPQKNKPNSNPIQTQSRNKHEFSKFKGSKEITDFNHGLHRLHRFNGVLIDSVRRRRIFDIGQVIPHFKFLI